MARGRAPNLSLPPTRQLANQRDYRARKAQYISGLEEKVKTLEGRVEDLEAELLQARLGGGATGMGSKEASELRSALLQSLALVNHAYPQREHRAERLASTSSTPASLPESPPLSIPSPAYPPPSTLHRQPSFSPHHQQQQQQQQQQYHPEPGPSTYFSQPQQFGSPFATSHANERKGGGSISTQASASSSSSQHSQDHQLGLIEDPSCCAGIFDCSPFPSTSTNSTSTPTIVTSSSFPSPPLPVGAGGPSPPQQQQQQQQHHQVNNGKPSSSSSSTNSGCCPPNQPQQPQAQPQPQQQQPSSSLLQQPQPLQLSHLTQQQQQQLHHLAQQQQQQQQHLRNQQQQHVLQHPLLLLAQTSVMGDEEVCCDVETAMRDGCAPLANGGWAKAVGMQHGMAVGAGGGMQQSMRS